ncbi:MAG: hypothetical protein V4471_07070 [Pseudomonadota bacterium]
MNLQINGMGKSFKLLCNHRFFSNGRITEAQLFERHFQSTKERFFKNRWAYFNLTRYDGIFLVRRKYNIALLLRLYWKYILVALGFSASAAKSRTEWQHSRKLKGEAYRLKLSLHTTNDTIPPSLYQDIGFS